MIEPPVWDDIEGALRELPAPLGLRPVMLQAADRIQQLEIALKRIGELRPSRAMRVVIHSCFAHSGTGEHGK